MRCSAPHTQTAIVIAIGFCTLAASVPLRAAAQKTGTLTLRVTEESTEKPLAVRAHLRDAQGKPVRPPKAPFWRGHFVFDGRISLELAAGDYAYEIERGPEYFSRRGSVTVKQGATTIREISMERFIEMKKQGWWSGELHVHRPVKDIELLMKAEDLHIAPVITWWNNRNLFAGKTVPQKLLSRFDENRFYHVMSGEDEREGGALMYFHLSRPLPLIGSRRETPSPMVFLEQARQREEKDGLPLHVDIEKPFWWDTPIWAASGKIDTIGICHNHMWRGGVLASEAWGKPRDKAKFPAPQGNGHWTQTIYYHLLNCGLRIPPSAGSASGVLPNPVGYNRVYVYCGEKLDYKTWWRNLRAGSVFVTNGPLIEPRANGELPGKVFQADSGKTLSLQIAMKLAAQEEIKHVEIIHNGRVFQRLSEEQWRRSGGKLPPILFEQSGWALVRVMVKAPHTFRFASSGPWHVQIGDKRRVSKASAQFFVGWVKERAARVKIEDPAEREKVLRHHRTAQAYYSNLARSANAP